MTVPTAPAPWLLRGDAHALFVQLPLEFDRRFLPKGRPGRAMVGWIRYVESDVGPYDELLFAPLSSVEADGERDHTITRIFVSTQASVDNGRRNWGIPKQLARFEVEQLDSPRTERVRVFVDEREIASFRVDSNRLGIPVDSRMVPGSLLTIAQELDGTRFRFAPAAKGRLHKAHFSELRFDGELFPDVSQARYLGAAALRRMEMRFPVAQTQSRSEPPLQGR